MPKGLSSLGPGAVSLSAAVHAAVVGGALLASVLGREPWPETAHAAVPRGPMVLDMATPRGNRAATRGSGHRERTRLPRIEPPDKSSGATPASIPPNLASINTVEVGIDPTDLLPDTAGSGDCATGCVVGPGHGGGEDGGAMDGGGFGPAQVVLIGRGPGGSVSPPIKVHDVAPTYPDLAIRSRVEGKVEVECRIDTTGRVVDATVLRGHPLLAPAALDAVRRWIYRPTLLNGVPVSVIMTVTVHFRVRG